MGKTVATATNSVTTYYVVDELNPTGYAQVLEELTATSSAPTPVVTRVYTYGHARVAQDRLAGSQWIARLYGYDGHNSVRYLTDLDGIVTDTYDYDAFGNLIAQTGSTPNAYLFTGEQYDADLGLYYLRARYHNPDTGRFWSQDSFEGTASDPASLHKYTYTGNNPVNARDPSGNFTLGQSMYTVAYASMARGLLGATLGSTFGSISGFNSAVARGATSNEEIAAAMRKGAVDGAVMGGFFGLASGFGAVGTFGTGMVAAALTGQSYMLTYVALLDEDFESAGENAMQAAFGTGFGFMDFAASFKAFYSNGPYIPRAAFQAAESETSFGVVPAASIL